MLGVGVVSSVGYLVRNYLIISLSVGSVGYFLGSLNRDSTPAPPFKGMRVAVAGVYKPHGTPLPLRGGAGVGSVML